MRRRDILKVSAGAAAVGVLGEGAFQLIHVVNGDESDVYKAQELLEEAIDSAEGTVNLNAYSIFTSFPVEVQYIPQDQFEGGLLFFAAEDADANDIEAISEQILESGCVVGVDPLVTNFPIVVRHVDENLLRDGVLLVSATGCDRDDVELLKNCLVERGCDESRLVVVGKGMDEEVVEARHFDNSKQAIETLERERFEYQRLLQKLVRITTGHEGESDESFRGLVERFGHQVKATLALNFV